MGGLLRQDAVGLGCGREVLGLRRLDEISFRPLSSPFVRLRDARAIRLGQRESNRVLLALAKTVEELI